MELYRLPRGDDNGDRDDVSIEAYIDYLETRRQIVIMELRALDRVLIRAGRLRRETLPTRAK